MKKTFIIALVFIFSQALFAAKPEVAKIAIIDVEKIFTELSKDKEVRKEIRKEISDAKSEIERKVTDIEKTREKLKESGLTERREQELKYDLEIQENELSKLIKKHEGLIKNRGGQVTQKILADIYYAAKEIADDKGFNIVLERQKAGIVFSIASFDITADVLEYLEKQKKESGTQ